LENIIDIVSARRLCMATLQQSVVESSRQRGVVGRYAGTTMSENWRTVRITILEHFQGIWLILWTRYIMLSPNAEFSG